MGKIKNIIYTFCAALFATACTDGNDWVVDSSYDRLFSTTESSFSITPAENAAQAEASWKATPNTTGYVIEVSTNPLSDDVPMGSEGSIVYGDGVEKITKTTYLLENLESETEYYARIKSVGDGKESNWVYYDDGGTFKTKKEQILKTPTEITDSSIKVSWEENCTVTSLRIYDGKGYDQIILLEAAELQNCSITIQGLDPMTAYTIEIYNGDRLRGTITVNTEAGELYPVTVTNITETTADFSWTETVADGYAIVDAGTLPPDAPQSSLSDAMSCSVTGLTDNKKYDFYIYKDGVIVGKVSFTTLRAYPEGYTLVEISSQDELTSQISSASGDVVFIIPEGVNWNLGDVTISDNLTNFIVWGKGTNKPSLNVRFTMKCSYGTVEFYNLKLSSEMKSKWDSTYLINYQPNNDANASIEELIVDNCDFEIFGKAIRAKSKDNSKAISSLGNITVRNCYFNGGESNVISLDEMLDPTETTSIQITNSTFVNNAKAIFRVGSPCDISLDYCTFYIKSTEDIYRVGDNVYNMSVNNSLFGGSVEVKLCGDNCTLTKCENTYSSKDFGWKKDYGVKSITLSTSELFPNIANGSYKAADSYSIYGDQNWN